jgi:hypothetical protein
LRYYIYGGAVLLVLVVFLLSVFFILRRHRQTTPVTAKHRYVKPKKIREPEIAVKQLTEEEELDEIDDYINTLGKVKVN